MYKKNILEAFARLTSLSDDRKKPPPPIPCRGYEINTPDQHEYDCAYEHVGDIDCGECIVNGGDMDPRTGKKARKPGINVVKRALRLRFATIIEEDQNTEGFWLDVATALRLDDGSVPDDIEALAINYANDFADKLRR